MQHGPAQPENSERVIDAGGGGADTATQEPSGDLTATESLVQALSDGGTGLLFLGGVLVAFFIVMRGMRKGSGRRKAQTREMSDAPTRLASLHQEAAASTGPARKTLLELEETARRFSALLDTKAAKLEILIEQADERLARLDGGGSDVTNGAPAPGGRGVRPEMLDRARVEEDLAARLREPEPKPEPDPEPMRIQDAPSAPNRVKTTQDTVAELADQGLDAAAIAREIDKPVGQVELMLNIWRNSG